MRDEFEAFLVKFSKGIADARKRERFLSNNHSLIGAIIGDVEGKLAAEMKEFYATKA